MFFSPQIELTNRCQLFLFQKRQRVNKLKVARLRRQLICWTIVHFHAVLTSAGMCLWNLITDILNDLVFCCLIFFSVCGKTCEFFIRKLFTSNMYECFCFCKYDYSCSWAHTDKYVLYWYVMHAYVSTNFLTFPQLDMRLFQRMSVCPCIWNNGIITI